MRWTDRVFRLAVMLVFACVGSSWSLGVYAQVTELQAPTNVYNAQARPNSQSVTYPILPGSNRMLVLAVASMTGDADCTGTKSVTASWGGQSLGTPVVASTGGRNNTWILVLREGAIAAASGNNLVFSATFTGDETDCNVAVQTSVYAAVYAGVDQNVSALVSSSSADNSGDATVDEFAPALEIPSSGRGIELISTTAGQTDGIAPTLGANANWTTRVSNTAGGGGTPATRNRGAFLNTSTAAGSRTDARTVAPNSRHARVGIAMAPLTPPTITSVNNATFTELTFGSFPVTATGTAPITFSHTGALPAGVSFSSAGVLSGTPAAGTVGIYPLTITAANGVGSTNQSFTLRVALPGGPSLAGVIYPYENTTSTTIPNNSCANPVEHTFVVPDSFIVGGTASNSIAIGALIQHPDREELTITLVAPDGSTQVLQTGTSSASVVANLNVMYSANDEAESGEPDLDPLSVAGGEVRYRRLVPAVGLDTFYTGPANGAGPTGIWRLRVCDSGGSNTASGTLQRSRLVLRTAFQDVATNVCGSTSSFEWGSNGNAAPFSNTTVQGITITQQAISGNPPNDSLTEGFVTCNAETSTVCNSQRGLHVGYYGFGMDGDDIGTPNDAEVYVEWTRFGFSEEVLGLNFEALDVDRSGGFEDMVRIEAFDALGLRVPYRMTLRGTQLAFAGDWAEADANVDNNQVFGNVEFRFDRPVRTLWVQYAQGDQNAVNSATQVIAISDFSWCAFDYGDAPSPYAVTAAANGPRHVIGNRLLFIGVRPDGESNGGNSTNADGDQTTNGDESPAQSLQGGVIPNYVPQGGQVCGSYTTQGPRTGFLAQYCVVVNATNNGTTPASLVGWIDFNGDGDFIDAGERSLPAPPGPSINSFVTGNLPAGASGPQVLVWDIPELANPPAGYPTRGQSVLRLRVSTAPSFVGASANPQPLGLVSDGEVEDHLIGIGTLPVTLASVSSALAGRDALRVTWTTATETGTQGFRILQQGADGKVVALDDAFVPSRSMSSTRPQQYEITVQTQGDGAIFLEEVAVSGKTERFGPYAIGATIGAQPRLAAPPWNAAANERRVAVEREDRARVARARQSGSAAAEILVDRTGLQRVAVADLTAAGLDLVGRPVASLRLSHGDEVVPMRVVGSDTVTAGGWIEFWGESVADSLYTRTRPYRLAVAAGGVPWAQVPGAPDPGLAANQAWQTTALDEDRSYSVSAPNGDPWYYDVVFRNGASASRTWTINLPGADAAAGGYIELALWGGSANADLAPDHRYRVSVNGLSMGEGSFDGVSAHEAQFRIPGNILVAGANSVRIDLLDTGDRFDRVFVDRIAILHKARIAARDGVASVDAPATVSVPQGVFADSFDEPAQPLACGTGCEQLELAGFQSSDLVALQVGSAGVIEVAGAAVVPAGGGFNVRLRPADAPDQGAGTIVVTERARAARPAVRPAIALPDPALGGPADLLLITSARFETEVGALVAARQAEGLRVRVVTVDQIYAHYSDGIVDPEAIRSFVRTAAQNLETRYVLLVGGDTYDYFDRYATGSISDVPTLYRKTHEYVSYAPVDPAYGDIDEDGRPDVAVGRLPARTSSELASLISKALEPLPANAYTGLFAAERANPAEGINYAERVGEWIAALPPSWQSGVTRLNLDDYPATTAGTDAARAQFLSQVNQGRNWVAFYGHASPATWSRETLLDAEFLPGLLANAGKSPVVTEFGCWGGYFVEPTYTTLNHAWLLTQSRGARAMIASSSLTESASDEEIARALIPAFATPGIRLGDALLGAQGEVHMRKPEMKDVIYGMSLFGDPSARLTPPN